MGVDQWQGNKGKWSGFSGTVGQVKVDRTRVS